MSEQTQYRDRVEGRFTTDVSEEDVRDHGINLDEVYRLVEVATKTMHFPKLAPIHAAAMKALEAHAAALLPEPEPVPEPEPEDQGQATEQPIEPAVVGNTDRRF